MERRKILSRFAGFILAIMVLAVVHGADSPISNGDFEKTVTVPEKDAIYKRTESMNFKIESPLVLPEGWTLNLAATAKDGEFRLISDSTQAQSGNNCIYLKGHLMSSKTTDVNAGDEMDISLYARNSEKSDVIFYFYCYGKNEEGKRTNIGALSFPSETGTEWTLKSSKIKIPEAIQGKKLDQVKVALTSRAGAYIDNVQLSHRKAAGTVTE